jgi:hypothetical protein
MSDRHKHLLTRYKQETIDLLLKNGFVEDKCEFRKGHIWFFRQCDGLPIRLGCEIQDGPVEKVGSSYFYACVILEKEPSTQAELTSAITRLLAKVSTDYNAFMKQSADFWIP